MNNTMLEVITNQTCTVELSHYFMNYSSVLL